MDDKELDAAIEAARERKATAEQERAAADADLGKLFALVIREKRDLKAKAKLADVSRQTAYTLAAQADDD